MLLLHPTRGQSVSK